MIEGLKPAGDAPPLPVELVGGMVVRTIRLATDKGGEVFAVVVANGRRSYALYYDRNDRCFAFVDL